MPGILERTYDREDLIYLAELIESAARIISEALNRAPRIEDFSSRNKPLAQGKRSKRGAKGQPAKGGVKARKGTRKK